MIERTREFTSQLYFDDNVSDRQNSRAGYESVVELGLSRPHYFIAITCATN